MFDDRGCFDKLEKFIDKRYNVINKIVPNCKWNNLYYEIQL